MIDPAVRNNMLVGVRNQWVKEWVKEHSPTALAITKIFKISLKPTNYEMHPQLLLSQLKNRHALLI